QGLQRLARRLVRAVPGSARGGRGLALAGSEARGRRGAPHLPAGIEGRFRATECVHRPLHHPAYTPVWEALAETGLPIAFHPAGLSDMPGASRALGGLMAPGTHHALILLIDQQMTLSNLTYGGLLERFPELTVTVLH